MGKFYGLYERNLDAKKRLQVPSKLLPEDGSGFVAVRGFEGCLSIYSETDFEALERKLDAYDAFKKGPRTFLRLFYSSVTPMPLDSHGRISLTEDLSRKYGLGEQVILIGAGNHFEIWGKEAYGAYEEANSSAYEDLSEALGTIGEN